MFRPFLLLGYLLLGLALPAQGESEAAVLQQLAAEAEAELSDNILPFWRTHVPHPEHGGFYGEVDRMGRPRARAPRAALMTSRILWTFSAAHRLHGRPEDRAMADRAFRDLLEHFWDREHGGVFWSLSAEGEPAADFKHVYGQAFAVYALAEYARATGRTDARERALELFRTIERHARDAAHGGYHEAFTRDWKPQPKNARMVVGPSDQKSQNTHLHVMEAYANLLRVTDDPEVRAAQRALIEVILTRIVDPKTTHLGLFFSAEWQPRSTAVSPGHNIEFAWLITEAATELGEAELLARVKTLAVRVADVTLREFVAADGAIPYEVDADGRVIHGHREWWVPAEAAVGFLNAYQLTGERRYLDAALQQWRFIQTHLVDREHGEWFHSMRADGRINTGVPKASAWKCPYHNGRACLELAQRARALLAAPARG